MGDNHSVPMTLSVKLSEHSYDSLIAYLDSHISDLRNFEILGEFVADYRESKTIRDIVSHLLQRNNVRPPWDRRFALITDELVNNSIEHGSALGDTITFRIIFSSESAQEIDIRMEIADRGTGTNAKTAAEMEEVRNMKLSNGFEKYRENRGRGLFQIIVRLVDTLYFGDNPEGGLIVGITKKLSGDIIQP